MAIINALPTGGGSSGLPSVTSSDNGKVLEVVSGDWAAGSAKAPVDSPVFTTSVSMGRQDESTVGENSVALGNNVIASNNNAFAEGYYTTASGNSSHAEGRYSTASAEQTHAEGYSTTASATNAHAEGSSTTASGTQAHAEGQDTVASGLNSHAEGYSTQAVGAYSHAEGCSASNSSTSYGARGKADHAEGYNTIANSGSPSSYYGAHAEGNATSATSNGAHAEGYLTTAAGACSHAEGYCAVASNNYAHAEGYYTTASNSYSHAEGNNASAIGQTSHAEGNSTLATGTTSHAEGDSTTASGTCSHAEGDNTKATNSYTHAEGCKTQAAGQYSHAEGYSTDNSSTSYGARGKADHVEGYNTLANSGSSSSYYGAHAEGNNTKATNRSAHAEGYYTTASGVYSHAEGDTTNATSNGAHAEGHSTTASGAYSHAEGDSATASGSKSHAEGNSTTASGAYSHAEGSGTTASGGCSHAEGYQTIASGQYQHVSGYANYSLPGTTIDIPDISLVESYDTTKDFYKQGSIVKVDSTIWVAHNNARVHRPSPNIDTVNWHIVETLPTGTVPSEWLPDTAYPTSGTYVKITDSGGNETYYQNHNALVNPTVVPGVGSDGNIDWHSQSSGTFTSCYAMEIVGNGEMYTAGRNIRMLDVDGNEHLAGDVYVGCNADSTGGSKLAKVSDVSTKADKADPVFTGSISLGRTEDSTVGSGSVAIGYNVTASGSASHAEGASTIASGASSHAEGAGTTASGNYSHTEGTSTIASGDYSHAEGSLTTASGAYSHSEGFGYTYTYNGTTYTPEAAGVADHTEGYCCLTTSGQPGNHAEGYQTQATGGAAHSEGNNTIASGSQSHAEGSGSKSIGPASHAEGSGTTASGGYSHAEGYYTTASGYYSHSEGNATTASDAFSHAEGSGTVASMAYTHAEGCSTIASGECCHAGGAYNIDDNWNNWPEWVSGTSYVVGDKVKRTTTSDGTTSVRGLICKVANSDSVFTSSRWTFTDKKNFVEIIGNGTDDNARSNARALDWEGNERIMGDLYVGCNADSTGGTKLQNATVMTGANGSTAGTSGLVPVPAATDNTKFLRGDGTWQNTPNELPAVTGSDNGKLLGVSSGAWAAVNAPTELPTAPVSDGTYILQCTVASGTPTLSWVNLTTWQGGSY